MRSGLPVDVVHTNRTSFRAWSPVLSSPAGTGDVRGPLHLLALDVAQQVRGAVE